MIIQHPHSSFSLVIIHRYHSLPSSITIIHQDHSSPRRHIKLMISSNIYNIYQERGSLLLNIYLEEISTSISFHHTQQSFIIIIIHHRHL